MKKIPFGFVLLSFIACNSNGSSSSSEDTTITNVSGVENVNGNIPDTTNAITVDGSSQSSDKQVDSTEKR